MLYSILIVVVVLWFAEVIDFLLYADEVDHDCGGSEQAIVQE